MSFARFQIRKHKVLHQMIDGEVVIINLDTGNYYSLRGTGAALWSAVEHGAAIREIVGALARKYQAAADVLERSVADFVEQLQREGLIEACGHRGHLNNTSPPPHLNLPRPAGRIRTADPGKIRRHAGLDPARPRP